MNIKQRIQAPLRRGQADKYEARIAEQTLSYHDWILDKEKEERAGLNLSGALSVRCVSYQDCGSDFSLDGNAAQASKADITVFYGDAECPLKEDLSLLTEYFVTHPEAVLVYADEDEIAGGVRQNPWLKPDWSPDTLFSCFYFGNLFAVRTEAVRAIAWLHSSDYRENIYDFCLKVTDHSWNDRTVGHLDSVLAHMHAPIVPFGMEEAYDEIKRQACIRRGWPLQPSGKVSIVILSKDHPGVLSTCIHSILEASTYRDFEIIVLDNGSSAHNRGRIERMLSQLEPECRFQYVYTPQEFNFSRLCNQGARLAGGEYLLLLNDDIEIIQEDWLERMVEKAALPHVGAVGVKLLYPFNPVIQHAGITNLRLGPAHKLQFRDDRVEHYFLRNRLCYDMLGVTGACLMVRRSLYEESGGLNEDLRVAFNDVDYCYRLHDMGYVNVVRNDVTLYHHESLSRGLDDNDEKLKRLHGELEHLYELHPSLYGRDPYYHRYLVTDVLDQSYRPACLYEYQTRMDTVVPRKMEAGLAREWSNEVLRMGVEFAGDMQRWEKGRSGGGNYYIQGWCYALQVDNRQYRFNLILKEKDRDDGPARGGDWVGTAAEAVWKLPVSRQYRPDIQENLGHLQYVALTGVSAQFDRAALPEGEYRIGFLWEDACSRQKLYQWTAETLRIVH